MATDDESPFRDRGPIANDRAETVLSEGEITVLGRMPWSSNITLLCDVAFDDDLVQAIYKPANGERPLWDFPDGLYRREAACYALARALTWDVVPPTVVVDGPVGPGSLQLFIPCDFEEHYFTFQDDPTLQRPLEQLVAFDIVANSTDRKSGHVLIDGERHIWAIDNGLSFHTEFKLRTVLWDLAGDPVPDELAATLRGAAASGLGDALAPYLDDDEIEAAEQRARTLATNGHYPTDPTGRRWPWPLV